MSLKALLFLGAASLAVGMKYDPAVGALDYVQLAYLKFPDEHCNPRRGFSATFLGRFLTLDECAIAVRDNGTMAFTYEKTGRWIYSCFLEENMYINQSTWDIWMAELADPAGDGNVTYCPGGHWIPDLHTWFYSWPPSAFSGAPTPAPTPAPPLPPSTQPMKISATGDPHLINIHGQRFDIFKPGVHKLLQIPRFSKNSSELLRLTADAQQVGGLCGDMYFRAINITGKWAPRGGYQFFSNKTMDKGGKWRHFGPLGPRGQVGLKIAWGHTGDNFPYLNVYVKNLKYVSHPVGGLLGDDDHTVAATPGPHCKRSVSLLNSGEGQGGFRSWATVM